MASTESPTPQPTLDLTPLAIAISVIVSAVLMLVVLHFFLKSIRSQLRPSANPLGATPGVDKKVLDSILAQPYGRDCCYHEVCLSVLEQGEMVRVLPNCCHAFHVQCIDAWFASHVSCPLCRSVNLAVDVGGDEDCDLEGRGRERLRISGRRFLDHSCNV